MLRALRGGIFIIKFISFCCTRDSGVAAPARQVLDRERVPVGFTTPSPHPCGGLGDKGRENAAKRGHHRLRQSQSLALTRNPSLPLSTAGVSGSARPGGYFTQSWLSKAPEGGLY